MPDMSWTVRIREPGVAPGGGPVNSASEAALLAAAGTVAGIVGTSGGITSLVSYPALLWAGVSPWQANVVNIISLVACWPGAALASRPELEGQRRGLQRWTAVSAVGGTAGSLLLLFTPPGVFGKVVPFLVAVGSLALLLQPRITSGARGSAQGGGRLLLPGGIVVLSAYNGYFGAGSGVILLALMLLVADDQLPRANALKNMLVGGASIASAVIFAVLSDVTWGTVVPLAAGMFAGSTVGPVVARRIPPGLLRWLAATTGLGFAVQLWITGA